MTFRLVEYDPIWPAEFELQRSALTQIFAGTCADIEHIGSTAVPGLCAKPIIDILLGAASLADIEQKIDALSVAGVNYVREHEREIPMRRYFVKPESKALRVNLHAVCRGSSIWREHLAFRDRLRSDSVVRDEYATLKKNLLSQYSNDRPAYTAAKAPFIQQVIAGALVGARNVVQAVTRIDGTGTEGRADLLDPLHTAG